jgi:hypothetical protein
MIRCDKIPYHTIMDIQPQDFGMDGRITVG